MTIAGLENGLEWWNGLHGMVEWTRELMDCGVQQRHYFTQCSTLSNNSIRPQRSLFYCSKATTYDKMHQLKLIKYARDL